tara:strand:- start:157 stop:870 length:714 start_codon:yes stop_codon:yes gene_type:complete
MEKYQIKLFKRADKLIFETIDAQEIFCTRYNYNIVNTFVVGNRLNQIFLKPQLWQNRAFNFDTTNTILCLSANYKHKNIAIIPGVIDSMKELGLEDFKFVLSLNKEEVDFETKYDEYIEYLGKLPLEVLPSLFQSVDLLFMPTLLECFSTTYLEAMFMGVPIVTTDMSFARDICRNAALYYNPLKPEAAARDIKKIILNKDVRLKLVNNGKQNLKRFGSSEDRTREYLRIINETLSL